MQLDRKLVVAGLGEVLWDMLPGGKQLGGACANFAYHAHALGAEAWLISRVGNDLLGREICDRLHALGVSTECVSIDPDAPTGTVAVEVAPDGQPCFTIFENVAWDSLTLSEGLCEVVKRADAICFGTLAQRCKKSRDAICSLVASTPPEALRIFDINLRQKFYSPEIIEASLKLCNVLKINDQELPVLAGMLGLGGDPDKQMAVLARRYQLRLVALTCGSRGSLLYADGRCSTHPGVAAKVVDTVGAGDAFTAMLAVGLLSGLDLDVINQRANELAAFVVSQPGATPKLPPAVAQTFLSRQL